MIILFFISKLQMLFSLFIEEKLNTSYTCKMELNCKTWFWSTVKCVCIAWCTVECIGLVPVPGRVRLIFVKHFGNSLVRSLDPEVIRQYLYMFYLLENLMVFFLFERFLLTVSWIIGSWYKCLVFFVLDLVVVLSVW